MPTIKISSSKLSFVVRELFDFILVLSRVIFQQPSIIWIGDSHTHFFSRNGQRIRHFSFADNGQLVVWLGPKLLYTISNKGFNLSLLTKTILKLAGREKQFIISLGEIDCRVHFVPKSLGKGALEFDRIVANYKNSVLDFLEMFQGVRALVLTPIPPSDFGVDNPLFPRTGLIAERIQATRLITDSLVAASSGVFSVVNISQVLSDEIGAIDPRYSSDGVHVNRLGAKVVLQELGV